MFKHELGIEAESGVIHKKLNIKKILEIAHGELSNTINKQEQITNE